MVDLHQFSADPYYGVLIEDAGTNNSRLTLTPEGADFLLKFSQNKSFTIRCQTVVEEVIFRRSENSFTFYGGCKLHYTYEGEWREVWLLRNYCLHSLTLKPFFQFVQFLILK